MTSHKLVVAEKPSVARDLARVLGAKTRENGCLTGNGYVVTWCLGHLVGIALPEIQNPGWKKWSLDTLPMIPDPFKHSVLKESAEQFHIVKKLMLDPNASEIISNQHGRAPRAYRVGLSGRQGKKRRRGRQFCHGSVP